MGRASRRKQSRNRGATSAAAEAGEQRKRPRARARRLRVLVFAGIIAAALAVGLGVLNIERRDRKLVPATLPSTQLPDPDTSAMTPPVASAIRAARRAALARPESAAAVGQLGQVLHAHWLLDAAADCYEIARELAPEEFRWVYLLAGVEDVRGGDGERIDQLFREAIRLSPSYAPVYVRHADALLRLGRWPEARNAYAAAVERDPQLVLAHRGLGQAANLLGDGSAAVEHLERAAALAPADRITQIALARAHTLTARSDLAAEATRKAHSLTSQASLPDQIFFEVHNLAVDPETLRGRITRGLREGAYDSAIQALGLLEQSEGDGVRKQLAATSKQRANRLAIGGEFDAALLEFERAAQLDPADPETEHNWGTVLLRRGDLQEAQRHFEKAIELDPQSADSLYNLGVVLEELGRSDEAIESLAAAAAIDPRHLAAERLAELVVVSDR